MRKPAAGGRKYLATFDEHDPMLCAAFNWQSHAGAVVPECFFWGRQRKSMEIHGRLGNLTSAVSKTPKPIVIKFGMGDEVGNPYPYAKFYYDPMRGFCSLCPPSLRALRLVENDSASFLVLPSAYSQDPCTDFHDQYVKWRRFAQGCAFWESLKQFFYISTPFPPKMPMFGRFLTGLISREQFELETSNLACRLTTRGANKKCKIRSKRVGKRSRDLLLKCWDPHVSRERLELETSNLARRLTIRGTNKNRSKGVEKESRKLLLEFWDHFHISRMVEAHNFKIGKHIDHQ